MHQRSILLKSIFPTPTNGAENMNAMLGGARSIHTSHTIYVCIDNVMINQLHSHIFPDSERTLDFLIWTMVKVNFFLIAEFWWQQSKWSEDECWYHFCLDTSWNMLHISNLDVSYKNGLHNTKLKYDWVFKVQGSWLHCILGVDDHFLWNLQYGIKLSITVTISNVLSLKYHSEQFRVSFFESYWWYGNMMAMLYCAQDCIILVHTPYYLKVTRWSPIPYSQNPVCNISIRYNEFLREEFPVFLCSLFIKNHSLRYNNTIYHLSAIEVNLPGAWTWRLSSRKESTRTAQRCCMDK